MVFDLTDVPGIIGYVGNLLGEEGVNIAQMAVGRSGDKGRRKRDRRAES